MIVIQNPSENIVRIWGMGKAEESVYRLMKYVISTEVENGLLLHNVITGELVFLSVQETNMLKSLPAKYSSWMDELIEHHYLVKEDNDDKKTVDNLRNMWRTLCSAKEINSYVVLPTTNCNARCFYCYEDCVAHENMSDETADKLIDFIEKNHGNKPVRFEWFGGEPLIGISKIDRICKGLKNRNIEFSSTMISNGYLFNEDIAGRIKEDWKLKNVQITLDGTEKVYNEVKAYVNPCESPFKRVLNNIDSLIENGIRVLIRLNLGFHNYEDLLALSDELVEHFKSADKKLITIYAATLYQDCGCKPMQYTDEEVAFLHSKWLELGEHIKRLKVDPNKKEETKRKHFKEFPMPHIEFTNCMADWTDCVLVTPSGKLSKCEHHLNDNLVGDLDNGITDKELLKKFGKHRTFEQCDICPLYPNCIFIEMCGSKKDCPKLRMQAIIDGYRKSAKTFYKDYCEDE